MAMSVEKLALHCGIQVSSLEEVVTSEYYIELSRHLSQWKLIAPKVGLTDDEVAAIDAKPEIEKGVSFLETWKQKVAMKATYRALIESLLGIKSVEDARGVCQVLKGESVASCLHGKGPGAWFIDSCAGNTHRNSSNIVLTCGRALTVCE